MTSGTTDDVSVAIDRALVARGGLRAFAPLAWRIIEPRTPYTPGWHLDAIAEHLEAVSRGEIRRLIINVPPRHSKSSIVNVIWPCWDWIARPGRQWLSASHIASLAVRDTMQARRLLTSGWYQERWPLELAPDESLQSRFRNRKGGRRLVASVTGGTTGEGGDILVLDDPNSAADTLYSQAARERVANWWRGEMSTRLNDPRTGAVVLVQQRIHDGDLTGHLLSEGGWDHLMLPAEYESHRACSTSIGWTDPRTGEGELLWPERFGPDELAALKRTLGYAASGQLQQRPAPPDGGLLNPAWWRWYRTPSERPPIESCEEVVAAFDLAFKGGQESDATAGFLLGRQGSRVYAYHAWHGRWDFPRQLHEVRSVRARFPSCQAVLIEDAANAAALMSTLRGEVPGLIPVRARTSKEARAAAWSGYLEAGDLYLPEWEPWAHELVDECGRFPSGAHDDRVDAFGYAATRLLRGARTSDLALAVG